MDMSGVPSLRGPELTRFNDNGGAEALSSDVGTDPKDVAVTTSLTEVERVNRREQQQDEKIDPVDHARQTKIDEGRLDARDGTENPPGAMPTKSPEPDTVRESEFSPTRDVFFSSGR